MELTEDEINEKYVEKCGHCDRNMLLLHEYELTCISFGYNVVKRKHEFNESQRKKMKSINRVKNAEHKIVRICIDVYKKF